MPLPPFRAYDVILLDIVMPRVDGVAVCRRLRKLGVRVPIIAMTGNPHSATFTAAGFTFTLEKPFSLATLGHALRAVTAGSTTPW